MFADINHHRRRFVGNAAMTLAAAPLALGASAEAQAAGARPGHRRPHYHHGG